MIINTMQHTLTEKQVLDLFGLVGERQSVVLLKDLEAELFAKLANSLADEKELSSLAIDLINVIRKNNPEAMIMPIGSPAFMFSFGMAVGRLEAECWTKFLFSHTERESVEEKQADGTITKKTVFDHKKWLHID